VVRGRRASKFFSKKILRAGILEHQRPGASA
jgi:hypothetical protein